MLEFDSFSFAKPDLEVKAKFTEVRDTSYVLMDSPPHTSMLISCVTILPKLFSAFTITVLLKERAVSTCRYPVTAFKVMSDPVYAVPSLEWRA